MKSIMGGCQIVDVVAPVVLMVLGILGSFGVLNISPVIAYSMVSAGGVLTVANILILLHAKCGQWRAPKSELDPPNQFTSQGYINREHLNFGAPYEQQKNPILDVNSLLNG
jgi:hypothetical protein